MAPPVHSAVAANKNRTLFSDILIAFPFMALTSSEAKTE